MYMYHSDGPPCILGRYRLLGKLMGKGNYARVEEAVHLDVDNAHVAIKMIDTHTIKDPYVLRHLEREAKVLQQLKHPNIMAIFEVLRTGSYYCMVTEPLYGGELCTHVNRQPRGHLDEATTLVFGAQLISAVAHMHALNVVHRDLKTKNIMLSKRGDHVKIVDFGLGRTWSRTRPLLTHCGSPGYAAPEIYQRDRPYGPEVDLWSLGVVLYYMAVGRMPFPPCRDKGRTAEERRRRLVAVISKGATDHHVKLMGHFSPEFRDLVQGLLTASVPRRITLQQAIQHPWVGNRLRARQLLNIPYKLSSQERALVLAKVAILMKSTVQSIEAQWRQNRLGEVAAMCNILAQKQLSTYHASWALRPLRPVSPKRMGVMEAAGQGPSQAPPPYAPKGLASHRRGPPSEPDEAVAVVDQPPSSAYEGGDDDRQDSAASVTSLCSELADEQASLPPPPRPLALLHAPCEQDDQDEDSDAGEEGSMEESATDTVEAGVDEGGEREGTPAVAPAAVEGSAKTGDGEEDAAPTTGTVEANAETEAALEDAKAAQQEDLVQEEAKGQVEDGTRMGTYVVGCLLNDANGQEQLQPLPDTKVMFYTETILDNIHAAMAPATATAKGHKEATMGASTAVPHLPIKSALASQTGLSAKTRKAVSFSIITTVQAAQSVDSAVVEEARSARRDTGVQANLAHLQRHTSQGTASDRAQAVQTTASITPQPASQASHTDLEHSSRTIQLGKPDLTQNTMPPDREEYSELAGTASLQQNVCTAFSNPAVKLSESNEPLTQDTRSENQALAAKFFKTVPLSRKVSPEPKKNIFEARRWPFRSPRQVYQRMKNQSKLSVACLLDSQEKLINVISKQAHGHCPVLSTGAATSHSTTLPAHPEESGEEYTHGYDTQNHVNLIQNVHATCKPNDSTNYPICSLESGAHADEKTTSDGQNAQGPLHTVAEMVRTKLGAVKEKSTDNQNREKIQQKALPREKRSKPPRYRRFFPNRYRVDLALVMTLERSRKLILPSINSPWTPPKSDK